MTGPLDRVREQLSAGKLRDARRKLALARRKHVDAQDYWWLMGRLSFAEGDFSEAIAAFTRGEGSALRDPRWSGGRRWSPQGRGWRAFRR